MRKKNLKFYVALIFLLLTFILIILICCLRREELGGQKKNETPDFENDNLEYTLGKRNQNLISPFSKTPEYRCYGSCYCKNSDRRSVIPILSRVNIIVAALTSLFAYNMAQKIIYEDCIGLVTPEGCALDDIESDVETCDCIDQCGGRTILVEGEDLGPPTDIFWDPIEDTDTQQFKTFACEGSCLASHFDEKTDIRENLRYEKRIPTPETLLELNEYAKEMDCKQYELTELFYKYIPREEILAEQDFPYRGKQGDQVAFANLLFIHRYLMPACEALGRRERFYQDELWENFYCTGIDESTNDNPTVNCLEMVKEEPDQDEPEPLHEFIEREYRSQNPIEGD